MSQAASAAFVEGEPKLVAAADVTLRGTTRGMEISIGAGGTADAIAVRLTELLAEAPSFFAGSDARVAFEGELPDGALARLEQVATRFELKLIEVAPAGAPKRKTTSAVIRRKLADGSGPIVPVAMPVLVAPVPAIEEAPEAAPVEIALANTAPYCIAQLMEDAESARAEVIELEAEPATAAEASLLDASPVAPLAGDPAVVPSSSGSDAGSGSGSDSGSGSASASGLVSAADAVSASAAAASAAEVPALPDLTHPAIAAAIAVAVDTRLADHLAARPPSPKLVLGPVRSGVIVDHAGHVIILGDVNPGAEVRAEGNIIILGRLRGVAHAAIGRDTGCIIALSLQPQQLRIGRMVARAGDADRPAGGAEIAYITGEAIVVERFHGRLPSGLAASM